MLVIILPGQNLSDDLAPCEMTNVIMELQLPFLTAKKNTSSFPVFLSKTIPALILVLLPTVIFATD